MVAVYTTYTRCIYYYNIVYILYIYILPCKGLHIIPYDPYHPFLEPAKNCDIAPRCICWSIHPNLQTPDRWPMLFPLARMMSIGNFLQCTVKQPHTQNLKIVSEIDDGCVFSYDLLQITTGPYGEVTSQSRSGASWRWRSLSWSNCWLDSFGLDLGWIPGYW